MKRIPCTVFQWDDWSKQYVPIYFTRTYWGAKRIVKHLSSFLDHDFVILEIWNYPNLHPRVKAEDKPFPRKKGSW